VGGERFSLSHARISWVSESWQNDLHAQASALPNIPRNALQLPRPLTLLPCLLLFRPHTRPHTQVGLAVHELGISHQPSPSPCQGRSEQQANPSAPSRHQGLVEFLARQKQLRRVSAATLSPDRRTLDNRALPQSPAESRFRKKRHCHLLRSQGNTVGDASALESLNARVVRQRTYPVLKHRKWLG